VDQEKIIEEFRAALYDAGIGFSGEIIGDGKRHRYQVDGDSRGSENGWYVLHLDEFPTGVAASWKGVDKFTWRAKVSRKLSEAEKRELEKKMSAQRRIQDAEEAKLHALGAERAAKVWAASVPPPADHAYIQRKAIRPVGIRFHESEISFGEPGSEDFQYIPARCLVVPIRDERGHLTSLQLITGSSEKRFLYGGRISGGYATIAKGTPTSKILICEGYATGASLFSATEIPTVVAFNAGNLEPVALVMRKKFPNAAIIICGDDDQWTKSGEPNKNNTGRKKATAAASAIGAGVVFPDFPFNGPQLTDFNDLAVNRGLPHVGELIEAAIALLQENTPKLVESKPDLTAEPVTETESLLKPEPKTYLERAQDLLNVPFPKSQSQLSFLIAETLKDYILFDEYRARWYVYAAPMWRVVQDGQVMRMISRILDEKVVTYTRDMVTGLMFFLKFRLGRSPAIGKNEAVIDTWNRDANLIPFQNGVLDIRTMELLDHNPKHMFNWSLPYDYIPDAACPRFHDLVEWLSEGEQATKDTIYCFLAAIVRGRADLQRYMEIVGMPGTGKSTLLHVAKALVGNENTISTTMRELGKNRFETAGFYGKKLALFTDAKDWVDGDDVFKALTGQDPVRYEEKNVQQAAPFIYGGMVLVAANRPVTFDDSSTALMRRRITINVDRRLPSERKTDGYFEALIAEMPGVLNFILKFTNEDIYRVLSDKTQTRKASSIRALIDTNAVADWLDERCIFDPSAISSIGIYERDGGTILNADTHLYPNYCQWSEQVGKRGVVQLKNFSKTLIEILQTVGVPCEEKRRNTGKKLLGIRIRKTYDVAPRILSLSTDEHDSESMPGTPGF
jgi:putative DNA primase/helicase